MNKCSNNTEARDTKEEEEEKKKDGDETEEKTMLSADHGNESFTFVGAELCLHKSEVRLYTNLAGNHFIIIGGYENGIDASFNLAKAGKKFKVLALSPCWEVKTVDPSFELAPYTAAWLHEVTMTLEKMLNARLLTLNACALKPCN